MTASILGKSALARKSAKSQARDGGGIGQGNGFLQKGVHGFSPRRLWHGSPPQARLVSVELDEILLVHIIRKVGVFGQMQRAGHFFDFLAHLFIYVDMSASRDVRTVRALSAPARY